MKLEADFEDALAEALLDDVEHKLRDELVPAAIEQSHEILREYGARYDYHVGPIIDALQEPTYERTARTVRARWGWDHEAAPFFEFGTPDHYTIDGNPILSFVWSRDRAPDWVAREFEPEGDGYRVFFGSVDSGDGIAEMRFARDALNWLRREVAQ